MDTQDIAFPLTTRLRFPIDKDSSFPTPNPDRAHLESLGWRLRYGHIDQTDRYALAAIIDAYHELLLCTNTRALEIKKAYRSYVEEAHQ